MVLYASGYRQSGYQSKDGNINMHTEFAKGMTIENFRGIEFVRISSMPKEDQEKIWTSFEHGKIIKIIKDNSLMNDCILYPDFAEWQGKQSSPSKSSPQMTRSTGASFSKLAFE